MLLRSKEDFQATMKVCFIVYEFLGYTSVFSLTLGKLRTADEPWVEGPTCPTLQMRGQPGARRVPGREAAPNSLAAAIAVAHQAWHRGENEGSIRPFSRGLLRDSLPSELGGDSHSPWPCSSRLCTLPCICPSPHPSAG